MTNVTLIGIDTAKNIFHLYAVDRNGKKIYQRECRRPKFLSFLAQQSPCVVALEACSATHYWARKINALGHEVRLINARRVHQFTSRNKNDFNDARAVTKAARDPDTYFVAQKSVEQQAMQAVHIMRDAIIKQQTATVNSVRALLTEFGIVLPKGKANLKKHIPSILEDAENELPSTVREIIAEQYEKLNQLANEIKRYNQRVEHCLKHSESAKRLKQIPGMGPLISTALSYMIAEPKLFKNGRNCAASLGLTPKEHSTGGNQRLGKISREGNSYLRKIIVQGAQAVLQHAHKKQDPLSRWAYKLQETKGKNVAAIALANKMVRIAWAMLVHQSDYHYKPQHFNETTAII